LFERERERERESGAERERTREYEIIFLSRDFLLSFPIKKMITEKTERENFREREGKHLVCKGLFFFFFGAFDNCERERERGRERERKEALRLRRRNEKEKKD
jgi:hypothetical protein